MVVITYSDLAECYRVRLFPFSVKIIQTSGAAKMPLGMKYDLNDK